MCLTFCLLALKRLYDIIIGGIEGPSSLDISGRLTEQSTRLEWHKSHAILAQYYVRDGSF